MRLPDYHRMADPLTYPMLFPRGDSGWGKDDIPLARTTTTKKNVTALRYLTHRIQIRGGDQDYHLQHGRLTQEWIVNSYVKIEADRLNFLKNNQKTIKADLYNEVKKAAEQNRYALIHTHAHAGCNIIAYYHVQIGENRKTHNTAVDTFR